MGDYCEVTDVRRVLQSQFDYGTTTVPTSDDVEEFIGAAEDQIDQKTQRAWRERTVTEEYYDAPVNTAIFHVPRWTEIILKKEKIRTITALDVWNGNSYDDFLTNRTEGRNNDYWLRNDKGYLNILSSLLVVPKDAFKISYTYGDTVVPKDIKDATAMMAAIEIINTDNNTATINGTDSQNSVTYDSKIANMNRKIARILRNRSQIPSI